MALSSLSCRSDQEALTIGELHPNEENIPVITDSRYVLRQERVDTSTTPLLIDATWADLEAISIGVNEGGRDEMIGNIDDVAISEKAFHYLDSEYSEVRVYDRRGSLRHIIGKQGEGPGEFQGLVALAATRDGTRLFVSDMSGYRIQIFRQQDTTYALDHTFNMPGRFSSEDICVVNDYVYALGYSEELDGVIHKMTIDGEYVTSFGEPYKSANSLVRSLLSEEGRLECDEQNRIIGYAPQHVPVLRAYSETGTMLWQIKFADLKLAPTEEGLTEDGRHAVTYHSPKSGESSHVLLTYDSFTDSFIARYYTIDKTRETTPLSSIEHIYRVHAVSGLGEYLGQRLWDRETTTRPALLGLDSVYVYTVTYRPFPQFAFYERAAVFP